MSFWSKIFKKSEPISAIHADVVATPNGNKNVQGLVANEKLTSLINNVKQIGHPDYPLLRKEYATSSRIPCIDFSDWIIQQLKEKDYQALWAFVKTIYGEEDVIQVNVDMNGIFDDVIVKAISEKLNLSIADAKREVKKMNFNDNRTQIPQVSHLRKAFDDFVQKDFSKYIVTEEKMIFDLQAFFILSKGINNFNREFWIGEGKEAEALAKILSVYSFETQKNGFEYLVSKANKFLKEMKKDEQAKDYWKPYPYYKIDDISQHYSLNCGTDLIQKLTSLSLGERLHFFDYATTYSYSNYWEGNSTYKTRSYGIYEATSFEKISNLKIFEVVNDINAIPQIFSKGELKEKAEQNGFELKKSWTLEKIFNFLNESEEGKDFLKQIMKDRKVLKFKSEYKKDLEAILNYQIKLKNVADLLSMA